MEEVITQALRGHWVRTPLLISQMKQQHDMTERDAKIERGEKSSTKINSLSVWRRHEAHR